MPPERLGPAVVLLGAAEVVWGLLLLTFWRPRWPLLLTSAAMVLAMVVVGLRSPQYLAAAFNPVSLNLSVFALGLVGWLTGRDCPSVQGHQIGPRPTWISTCHPRSIRRNSL